VPGTDQTDTCRRPSQEPNRPTDPALCRSTGGQQLTPKREVVAVPHETLGERGEPRPPPEPLARGARHPIGPINDEIVLLIGLTESALADGSSWVALSRNGGRSRRDFPRTECPDRGGGLRQTGGVVAATGASSACCCRGASRPRFLIQRTRMESWRWFPASTNGLVQTGTAGRSDLLGRTPMWSPSASHTAPTSAPKARAVLQMGLLESTCDRGSSVDPGRGTHVLGATTSRRASRGSDTRLNGDCRIPICSATSSGACSTPQLRRTPSSWWNPIPESQLLKGTSAAYSLDRSFNHDAAS